MNGLERKWTQMLRAMLIDFREKHPNDTRSDWELLESLMEHFYEEGLVKKGTNGKYILPNGEGTIPLIN